MQILCFISSKARCLKTSIYHSFCQEQEQNEVAVIPQHSSTGLTRIFNFQFQVTVTKRLIDKKQAGFFPSKTLWRISLQNPLVSNTALPVIMLN